MLNTLKCALLSAVLLGTFVDITQSELTGVILVSRHGTRAPNLATAALCPNNAANLARYLSLDISLEGVTGRGMKQLLAMGAWCRSRYVESGFLAPFYSNEQLYIRAVGEDRTLQSAVAFGMGLYPSGRGAVGWPQGIPPPLPVYTLPDELDTLLENRKAGCHAQLAQDIHTYDDTIGRQHREKNADLLEELGAICGVNLTEITSVHQVGNLTVHPIENFGDAVKDITDNWTFDYVEQFPLVPGLNEENLLAFRTYAVEQLLGRILGTDDQITYLNGDLPMTMVESFEKLIDQRENKEASKGKQPLKFIAYHGHREMMYALAAWFHIDFNVSYPALPQGAIPAATTLLFELHTVDATDNTKDEQSIDQMYEVRAIIWTPCDQGEDESQSGGLLPIITADIDEEALNQTISGRKSSPRSHHLSKSHHSNTHSFWKSDDRVQCGARPIAINHHKCHDGVCSFAAFKSIVKARLRHTGEWKELCEADRLEHERDQEAEQAEEQNERDEDETERVAGRASDHEAKKHHDHEDGDDKSSNNMNSTASADVDTHSKSGAMMIVLYVLLGAIALGAFLYWFFVRRSQNDDRGEYQRV